MLCQSFYSRKNKVRMKFLVYALSVGALIGSYYSIAAGITYADIACALLLIISSYKFITHQWLTDRFFTLTAIYVPFMIAAALINGDLTNTIFINSVSYTHLRAHET